MKPVPKATASVYFRIDTNSEEAVITYVLEAHRLIHDPQKNSFQREMAEGYHYN